MTNIAKFGQKYIFAASAAAKCISVLTPYCKTTDMRLSCRV